MWKVNKKMVDTFEQVVQKAKKVHGDLYTYLGQSKLNGKFTLQVLCKIHGEFTQTKNNHMSGKGCKACATSKNSEKASHTLESVKLAAVPVHGSLYSYEDIDRSVVGKPTLGIVCSLHGKFTQDLYNHLAGKGCPKCALVASQDSYEVVLSKANQIHKNLYSYLAMSDTGNAAKLQIMCNQHGSFWQSKNLHLQGSGCPTCAKELLGIQRRLTITEVSERALELYGNAYTFPDNAITFEDGYTAVKFICKTHGLQEKPTDSFLRGQGCARCSYETKASEAADTLSEYIDKSELVHLNAYVYVAIDRSGTYPKIKALCPKHGMFTQLAGLHLQGAGCPACVGSVSKVGKRFTDYLHTLHSGTAVEVKIPNTNYRWDAAVVSEKVGFELHGLYWHSDQHKPINYHRDKHRASAAAGFKTLHIFEDEWESKRSIVERLCKSALGVSDEVKLHARKLQTIKVEASVASEFFKLNHIQGCTSASKYLGLKVGEKLVAVMGYACRASGRGQIISSTQAEITRYATNCKVRGGFGKLLSEIERLEPSLTTIYTFSDNRLFDGAMYRQVGFTAVREIRPDYFYVKAGKRQLKSTLQKSRIKGNGKLLYDPVLSEAELAKLNGYHRVYDCGKTLWSKVL